MNNARDELEAAEAYAREKGFFALREGPETDWCLLIYRCDTGQCAGWFSFHSGQLATGGKRYVVADWKAGIDKVARLVASRQAREGRSIIHGEGCDAGNLEEVGKREG